MDRARLNEKEIEGKLKSLPAWTVVAGKLHREYVFRDFIQAFGFMASAALIAEAMGHHPEWSNVYNRLVVDLTTHDAGGITQLDFELAGRMEDLAASRGPGG